ncbi:MAG: hypothetical protein OEZ24_02705 [Candidatus Bathyarchaeota archaeon]|nr:hypothetical protein [Candidatus Bathyarchaeota archaeon]
MARDAVFVSSGGDNVVLGMCGEVVCGNRRRSVIIKKKSDYCCPS